MLIQAQCKGCGTITTGCGQTTACISPPGDTMQKAFVSPSKFQELNGYGADELRASFLTCTPVAHQESLALKPSR